MRVRGTAYKKVEKEKKLISHEDLKEGLVFSAVLGAIDSPPDEVPRAVKKCKEAGLTVKRIIGDRGLMAMSIGNNLGIGDGETSLTDREIEGLSDEELKEEIKDFRIFVRTTPEHKIRIVDALQTNGHICGTTGDGGNDAPALKQGSPWASRRRRFRRRRHTWFWSTTISHLLSMR